MHHSLLTRLALFFALALLPALARAQQAGPTMAAATSGVRAPILTEEVSAQDAAERAMKSGGGLGTGGALMIVGGAAFLAGLIIGGGAGTALAVGGVLVAAYGLYVFLK
jgi:hypothetical protein